MIFDLSRSQADHINYEIIESIKNGSADEYEAIEDMRNLGYFPDWQEEVMWRLNNQTNRQILSVSEHYR